MGLVLAVVAVTGLAGCSPTVPDSGAPDRGAGVGFGDYNEYQRKREQQLTGAVVPAASAVSSETLPPSGIATGSATGSPGAMPTGAEVAAETRAALAAANGTSGAQPLDASPSNPAPVAVNPLGISRENDFTAVGEQRSIESDKARIAENRAQYTQVQPTELPKRQATGPNIVAFALQTTHPVGQQAYKRSNFGSDAKFSRNCAKYPSPDLAQTDFLKSGGPEKDRMGIDPDGDGYACSWDPRPFRKAAGG